MKFDRMPVHELKGALEQWFDSGESVFTIILTDGMMLHADLRRGLTIEGHRETVDEAWWNDLGIKLSISIDDHDGGGVFYHVTVPFEEIAGITPLKIYEEIRSGRRSIVFFDKAPDAPESDLPYMESSREVLKLDLFEKARSHNFPIESPFRYGQALGIEATLPPTYGAPDPRSDTFLYGDWEFFQRRAGGLRSLGVGIPWGSASVGWERSCGPICAGK